MKQRHYVMGSINGCPVRGSLGSDGNHFFLPLRAAWRRDTGVDVGATVAVVLEPEGPPANTLSVAALEAEPQATLFFESLATFRRNTYIRWIESAKRSETHRARIAELISLLNTGKKQR